MYIILIQYINKLLKNRANKERSSSRGAAFVEFAIVAGVLVFFTAGVLNIGRVSHQFYEAANAIKIGTRYAAMYAQQNPGTSCDTIAKIANDIARYYIDDNINKTSNDIWWLSVGGKRITSDVYGYYEGTYACSMNGGGSINTPSTNIYLTQVVRMQDVVNCVFCLPGLSQKITSREIRIYEPISCKGTFQECVK